jgi:hypothetical protein
MGKKITSSSPLNTIAFDAIPNTWAYANTAGARPTPTSTSSVNSGNKNYGASYSSTTDNSDIISKEPERECPVGKHMDDGVCVKNEKKSRGERLTDKMREDESMGKTASAARKRKRLASWELGQEKRTKQIEGGMGFFKRFARNTEDFFDKGAHTGEYDEKKGSRVEKILGGEKIITEDSSGSKTSRSENVLSRAKEIKTKEGERTECINDSKMKWENGKCVAIPGTNPPPVNNPVGVSSTTNYSQATNEGDCLSAGGRWSGGECWASK